MQSGILKKKHLKGTANNLDDTTQIWENVQNTIPIQEFITTRRIYRPKQREFDAIHGVEW